MLEGIKNLFSKLKKNPEQITVATIDPASIRENNTIRFQQNQIADLTGELDRLKSEQGLERESQRDIEEENEIKRDLNEQQRKIDQENFGTFFSLKRFFARYLKEQKFRDNLYFTTFNRSKNIAKVGDIGFCKDGIALFDEKNNKILTMQKLSDLFQSVSALGNDTNSLKIPINLDENGRFIENIMEYEPAEMYKVDGKIHYKASRKKPVYDLLAEKDEIINELMTDLAEKEDALDKLQNKVDTLQTITKVSKNSGEIARNEKTKMARSVNEIEEVVGHITGELSKQYRIHEVDEDTISKLEVQVHKLKGEAERSGSTPSFNDAIQKIENMFGIIKKNRLIPKESETPK